MLFVSVIHNLLYSTSSHEVKLNCICSLILHVLDPTVVSSSIVKFGYYLCDTIKFGYLCDTIKTDTKFLSARQKI